MSTTPIEDAIRTKLTTTLHPTHLTIHNDSHLHAHHAAMRSLPSPSKETHFRLVIVSDAFRGKMQPARHRMVYGLLREEMEREGGVHALQIRARTGEEEGREMEAKRNTDGQVEVNDG
ncbi:hypothetical protein MMC21_008114 [Puttea exsequens]|nr:hypothetical protein [Puttea exsequens]